MKTRLSVSRMLALAAVGVSMLAAAACAPVNTGSTYGPYQMGRPAPVDRGIIVSEREVDVSGPRTGVGTVVGAGSGAIIGSTIGRSTRANLLGAIGGAVIGGVIGTGVEQAVSHGKAVEFIVQRPDRSTFSIVQTNEDRLQVGEHVLIIHGEQTRLVRDTSVSPNYPYGPPTNAPQPTYGSYPPPHRF